ncbi:MAG: 30S ribosomal protein S17 [bacterium]|nr:30S ribosomal protein S17 [bacterium]
MKERGNRKVRVGEVISNKMDKTVIVSVKRLVKDSLYKKYIRKSTKYYAHDEENKCSVGNKVKIMETRPLSKTKRWRIVEVIN